MATSDIIIVGGGLAGLMATIKAAEAGAHVHLFSLVPVKRSHSVCAQGGINGAVNTKVRATPLGSILTTLSMAVTFWRISRRLRRCVKLRQVSFTLWTGWALCSTAHRKVCSISVVSAERSGTVQLCRRDNRPTAAVRVG